MPASAGTIWRPKFVRTLPVRPLCAIPSDTLYGGDYDSYKEVSTLKSPGSLQILLGVTCGYMNRDTVNTAEERLVQLPACPGETTLSLIGNKGQALILRDLVMYGTMRFKELQRSIGKISQKVLTSNLRTMEEAGSCTAKCSPRYRRAWNIHLPKQAKP